jgi:hypothetical protein
MVGSEMQRNASQINLRRKTMTNSNNQQAVAVKTRVKAGALIDKDKDGSKK